MRFCFKALAIAAATASPQSASGISLNEQSKQHWAYCYSETSIDEPGKLVRRTRTFSDIFTFSGPTVDDANASFKKEMALRVGANVGDVSCSFAMKEEDVIEVRNIVYRKTDTFRSMTGHMVFTSNVAIDWMPLGATKAGAPPKVLAPRDEMPAPGLIVREYAPSAPTPPRSVSPPRATPRSAPVRSMPEPGRQSTCKKYCGRPI